MGNPIYGWVCMQHNIQCGNPMMLWYMVFKLLYKNIYLRKIVEARWIMYLGPYLVHHTCDVYTPPCINLMQYVMAIFKLFPWIRVIEPIFGPNQHSMNNGIHIVFSSSCHIVDIINLFPTHLSFNWLNIPISFAGIQQCYYLDVSTFKNHFSFL